MDKIKITTRFNPTTNGHLHLGHLYILLVNEYMAHSTEGSIFVRLEDTQPEWISTCGWRQKVFGDSIVETIHALNIPVDDVIFQSDPDLQYTVREFAESHNLKVRMDYPPHKQALNPAGHTELYSYTPGFTLQKVIMDYLYGVNMIIRGQDLCTEYSLYEYYCDILGINHPRHVYLPRLRWLNGDVSKTNGGFKVNDFIVNGRWTPDHLIWKLKEACLKDPKENWHINNIKEYPIWTS